MADDVADVLVVGAGAGGAAAAWRLASGGLSVVCLEQGGHVAPEEAATLRDDWELLRQGPWHPNPNVRRGPADYPVDDTDCPIRPLMFNGVGGSTVMWSCHMPRFHPSDFRMRTLDGVGADWPVSYADLEPYYGLNERMTGVSGLAGDPAYPPRPSPTTPPAPFGPAERRVAAAFDRLGWSWWPADLAINTRPYGEGRGACNHCGPCELGCPSRAKGTADATYWPAALAAGARLVAGARVARITLDAAGRADGALWIDRMGALRRQRARVVVLAANGLGTPRLLLLSDEARHPRGLGNGADLVGRHLMLHPLARVAARFDEPVAGHRGITAGALVSHHFYETDRNRGFVRGFKLQLLRSHGPALVALGSQLGRMPWGAGHHARFRDVFGRTAALSVCSDDLPDPENRVTLHPTLSDGDGLPAPRMAYRVGREARAALDHGMDRAEEALREAGAVEVLRTPLVADAGFHLMGTARMGTDPGASVADPWGRVHGVPNLVLADASVFVTAAAVNPTHTLQALALRAADGIIARRRETSAAA